MTQHSYHVALQDTRSEEQIQDVWCTCWQELNHPTTKETCEARPDRSQLIIAEDLPLKSLWSKHWGIMLWIWSLKTNHQWIICYPTLSTKKIYLLIESKFRNDFPDWCDQRSVVPAHIHLFIQPGPPLDWHHVSCSWCVNLSSVNILTSLFLQIIVLLSWQKYNMEKMKT